MQVNNFDVVIVGGGPIGMVTACTLKAVNKDLNICVLDKRAQTTRTHGLHIDNDSISRVIAILQKSLQSQDPAVDRPHAEQLLNLFEKWKDQVLATNQIEDDLTRFACDTLGIPVHRGDVNTVTTRLFEETVESPLQPEEERLCELLKNAKVIIGADGSHSIVRDAVKIEQKGKEILQHLLEVKLHAPKIAKNRAPLTALFEASKCEGIDFETMGRAREGQLLKPVTRHIVIDEETFGKFQEKDADGRIIKGDHAHAWTYDEVEVRAATDEKVKKQFKRVKAIIARMASKIDDPVIRAEACAEMKKNVRITVLPMNIYQCEKAATMHRGKVVVLAGDAYAGIVLARGVNKGIHEAAFCVKAVNDYFHRPESTPSEQLPKEFEEYQENVDKQYKKEKTWAKIKIAAVAFFDALIKFFSWPFVKLAKLIRRPNQQAC